MAIQASELIYALLSLPQDPTAADAKSDAKAEAEDGPIPQRIDGTLESTRVVLNRCIRQYYAGLCRLFSPALSCCCALAPQHCLLACCCADGMKASRIADDPAVFTAASWFAMRMELSLYSSAHRLPVSQT